MLSNLIPIFIAWFSKYLIIQAVVTTIAFSNAPFSPRDHFLYYVFTFRVAEAVGRSYLVVLPLGRRAKFPYLWVLAIIQVALLLFLILTAWYRFLPSVWIVLLIVFVCGLTVGVLYVNAMALFRDNFRGPLQRVCHGVHCCGANRECTCGLVDGPLQ